MNKKGKVVNLFDHINPNPENENKKYSLLFSEFMKPFEFDFPDEFDKSDIAEFSMNAWNLGNLSFIISDDELKKIVFDSTTHEIEREVLNRMIEQKNSQYRKYDRFIQNFEINDVDGKTSLTVLTKENEAFVSVSRGDVEEIHLKKDLRKGCVNRQALFLTPKLPYAKWGIENCKYTEEEDFYESKIYLVNDEITDLELWLKSNFDEIFTTKLEEWYNHTNVLPEHRTYKMFQQWFDVKFAPIIMDMEEIPITKE